MIKLNFKNKFIDITVLMATARKLSIAHVQWHIFDYLHSQIDYVGSHQDYYDCNINRYVLQIVHFIMTICELHMLSALDYWLPNIVKLTAYWLYSYFSGQWHSWNLGWSIFHDGIDWLCFVRDRNDKSVKKYSKMNLLHAAYALQLNK